MGLRLTLTKEKNALYTDFADAYWCVKDITYTTDSFGGNLVCYPSRAASKMQGLRLESPYLAVGGPYSDHVNATLYKWSFMAKTGDIFPNGIPLDPDVQKTAIYNWVKSYTGLPFQDVFED